MPPRNSSSGVYPDNSSPRSFGEQARGIARGDQRALNGLSPSSMGGPPADWLEVPAMLEQFRNDLLTNMIEQAKNMINLEQRVRALEKENVALRARMEGLAGPPRPHTDVTGDQTRVGNTSQQRSAHDVHAMAMDVSPDGMHHTVAPAPWGDLTARHAYPSDQNMDNQWPSAAFDNGAHRSQGFGGGPTPTGGMGSRES